MLFRAADNKAYFSLLSAVLADERAFLRLEQKLSSLFPGMRIALRVASPNLADDFKADIQKYTPTLKAFLRRQSPAIKTWLDDVGWSIDGDQILLVCPDDFAMHFFKRNALDEKLSQAVWDIFRLKLPVALAKCGEREAVGGAYARRRPAAPPGRARGRPRGQPAHVAAVDEPAAELPPPACRTTAKEKPSPKPPPCPKAR